MQITTWRKDFNFTLKRILRITLLINKDLYMLRPLALPHVTIIHLSDIHCYMSRCPSLISFSTGLEIILLWLWMFFFSYLPAISIKAKTPAAVLWLLPACCPSYIIGCAESICLQNLFNHHELWQRKSAAGFVFRHTSLDPEKGNAPLSPWLRSSSIPGVTMLC